MQQSRTKHRPKKRHRATIWLGLGSVIAIDAAIATPVGIPLLYFVPIVAAGILLPRAEVLVLALLGAAARILFGPIGDPLRLHGFTVAIPESIQVTLNAVTSITAYVVAGVVSGVLARQRRSISSLQRTADIDALTGLPNRRAFDRFLAEHTLEYGAVLVIDVDHFKRVNDEHGHGAGDAVLSELGRRLRQVVRGADLVARIGGEEFVLVLPGATTDAVERVGNTIASRVRDTGFDIGSRELTVTVSVGASVGPLDASRVVAADKALYRSKEEGRDRVTVSVE